MEAHEPDLVLDLKGLKCPLPVLKSRKAMASLTSGALVRVLTTDPLAGLDIPHFCHEDGHALLAQERSDQGHVFLIRRA
ncbi:sulfurtransferase TusA family protein [Rhizobium sp. FKL33]|uniref:sulfurtransferase TusA family protein n=1 Tax=Rhizobium sp. FKL33 TaxID=2562307 RepID=UPI0010C0F03C|nr:sulfurtransferase TusA family protein [Rhizobium sp. FKL33]